MKSNEVVTLAQKGNSWIEGHADDSGDKFEFFSIYFGENLISIGMVSEDFSEIVDLFKEIINNEE